MAIVLPVQKEMTLVFLQLLLPVEVMVLLLTIPVYQKMAVVAVVVIQLLSEVLELPDKDTMVDQWVKEQVLLTRALVVEELHKLDKMILPLGELEVTVYL